VRDMERERVTVAEAAKRLGISESAVRKRVQRDQIDHERGEDRKLYVYLSSRDKVADSVQDEVRDRYITFLERELEARSEEIRRRDAIIMNMTEAMKAIGPPHEDAPESPESHVPSETPPDASGEAQEGSERPEERSWWRRLFEGG
jgi:DNA-binding Lrp family transcriptional regulator